MPYFRFPQVRLLAQTNLEQNYKHSILIAVLRGLAAVQVAAAHLRAEFFPGLTGMQDPTLWYKILAFSTGFSYHAVVIFFVLSGWLVGGSLLNKIDNRGSITNYLIDRVTRLWIVLIPALMLTLFIAAFAGIVDLQAPSFSPQNEYSVSNFAGNLLGFQDVAMLSFGGNFPLWSLANETWYYVLFPLMAVSFYGRSAMTRLASVAVLLLLVATLPASILLYFSLWLAGVAFSRIHITASTIQLAAIASIWVAIAIYFRITVSNDSLKVESFFRHLIFSLPILVLLSCLQTKSDPGRPSLIFAKKAGDLLAGFSFTLYVIHVPLLVLLRRVYPPLHQGTLSPYELGSLGIYLVMLAGIVVIAYVFHLPFEAQTPRLRAYIKRQLFAARRLTVDSHNSAKIRS